MRLSWQDHHAVGAASLGQIFVESAPIFLPPPPVSAIEAINDLNRLAADMVERDYHAVSAVGSAYRCSMEFVTSQ